MDKLVIASKQTGVKTIVICGGVSANSEVRDKLKQNGKNYGWKIHIPKLSYTTDNAAMIAMAAHFKYLRGEFVGYDIAPLAKMKF